MACSITVVPISKVLSSFVMKLQKKKFRKKIACCLKIVFVRIEFSFLSLILFIPSYVLLVLGRSFQKALCFTNNKFFSISVLPSWKAVTLQRNKKSKHGFNVKEEQK